MNATLIQTSGAAATRSQAIREVYEAYAERIYKFVYFKLGNREDSEDVTSQVFMKAAVSLDLAQDPRSILAWLYQVARTSVSDYWRRYYRIATCSLDDIDEDSLCEPPAEPVYPGHAVECEPDRDAEKVRWVLALLPEKYQRVLELRFLQGLCLKDTALAMNTTEGNVRVLQHRALRQAAALI